MDKDILKLRKGMRKSYAITGESDADGSLEDLAEQVIKERQANNP